MARGMQPSELKSEPNGGCNNNGKCEMEGGSQESGPSWNPKSSSARAPPRADERRTARRGRGRPREHSTRANHYYISKLGEDELMIVTGNRVIGIQWIRTKSKSGVDSQRTSDLIAKEHKLKSDPGIWSGWRGMSGHVCVGMGERLQGISTGSELNHKFQQTTSV